MLRVDHVSVLKLFINEYAKRMVGFTKEGFFFFQAEDGIRYHCVTGVQTCALPISEAAWAALTSAATGWPPSAHRTEADFGAEKVRSKPGTGPFPETCRRPSGSPVAGFSPVSIPVSWAGVTLPWRP